MAISIQDLARELNVTEANVTALADQLIQLDGEEAVVASQTQARYARGVWVTELTDEAAQTIREAIEAQRS